MDQKEHVEDDSEDPILATDLIKIVEGPILTFRLFLKMDKKKSGGFFRAHSPRSSLQQVQASLEKVCHPLISHTSFISTCPLIILYSTKKKTFGMFSRPRITNAAFPYIGCLSLNGRNMILSLCFPSHFICLSFGDPQSSSS